MRTTIAALSLALTLLVPTGSAAAVLTPDEETSSTITTMNASDDAVVHVYDYTTVGTAWTPLITSTVAEFNAVIPPGAPHLAYVTAPGDADCLDIPNDVWDLTGIIVCDTNRPEDFPYDPNAPDEGWAGYTEPRDDDTTVIALNNVVPDGFYMPAEVADNTVCHELMHAYTRVDDAYDSDLAGSCVWGNLLAPGSTDVRLMREQYPAPVMDSSLPDEEPSLWDRTKATGGDVHERVSDALPDVDIGLPDVDVDLPDVDIDLPGEDIGLPGSGVDTDSLRAMGNECLAAGDLACAKEHLEAAHAGAPDSGTRSDLYEFYVMNGDNWQQSGDLESARRAYGDAVRLDPARPEAAERRQRLTGYSAVELFDPFETFGRPGLNETLDGGASVHRIADGVLEISSTMPEWLSYRLFSHSPVDSEYAVIAEVESIGPSTAVGLILAHGPADDGFHFMVDPVVQQWWIAYRNPDGSWTDMILPVSYAGLTQVPIDRLEVQVANGTPSFFVNGVELTASFDMSWMHVPQTGDSGVAIESSSADPTAPMSGTFDAFGIYAL